jgi:hypothetical protein
MMTTKVKEALGHRYIGNVRAPDLVDPLDADTAEQVRIDFVRRKPPCLYSGIDRSPPSPCAASDAGHVCGRRGDLGRQPCRHSARAVIGPGQILPIDQRHDRAILLADRSPLAVNRGARYRQQPALLRYRQRWVLTLDQGTTSGSAHFAELSCQKNHFRLSAGRSGGTGHRLVLHWPRLGHVVALKHTRCAVQQLPLPIVDLVAMNPKLTRQLGDRPVALDRASATFALNPALCFFRVRFMSCSCVTGAF